MRLETTGDTLQVFLEWPDINALKEGQNISERYNGEHKFNLGCLPNSLHVKDWTTTASMKPVIEFNSYLHDFFVQIPVYDVRHSLIRSTRVRLAQNPFFETATIIFPE